MRHRSIALVALVLLAMTVAGCGGGPPTKMTNYESSAFKVEYPEGWQDSGMDFMGMTVAFLAEEVMDLEDFGGLDQPPDFGFVMLMYTPSTDSEFNLEDFDDEITEDESVEILTRGDITVDGQKGKIVKARGEVEDGGDEFALMMVVAEHGDNTFAFIGMSPGSNWSKNEDIFDYMLKTVKFE